MRLVWARCQFFALLAEAIQLRRGHKEYNQDPDIYLQASWADREAPVLRLVTLARGDIAAHAASGRQNHLPQLRATRAESPDTT